MIVQGQLFAIDVIVKLQEGRNFRKYDVNPDGVKYLSSHKGKVIPRGTELRIPLDELTDTNGIDRYKKMNSSQREAAVINWLKNPKWSKLQTFDFRENGKPKRDFFLKVNTQDGDEGFMQLKSLALTDKLKLVTTQDDLLVDEDSFKDGVGELSDVTYDNSGDDRRACVTKIPKGMFDLLSEDAKNAARIVEEGMLIKAREGLLRTTPEATVRNFNSSRSGCHKYMDEIDESYCDLNKLQGSNCYNTLKNLTPFEKFNSILKVQSSKAGVPYDLMLSLMSQESSGRCIANASDSGKSTGLFQINIIQSLPDGFRNKYCSRGMKDSKCHEVLKDVVSNPILNLELSLNLLKEKFKNVNKVNPLTLKSESFNDLEEAQRDRWRFTLSAYNGGPTHVRNAKEHVLRFNRKNGTSLDPDDWNTRRAFLMKNLMTAQHVNSSEGQENIIDQCKQLFKGNQTDKYIRSREFKDKLKSSDVFGVKGHVDWRHVCFARINVSFVDTILGIDENESRSRIDEWRDYLR